jgi:hypothetical protein
MLDYLKEIESRLIGHNPYKLRDDAAMLVIGLGGSGIKHLSYAKRLLSQRFMQGSNDEERKIACEEFNNRVKFHCLDTATDDQKKYGIPDGDFDPLSVIETNNEWMRSWLNPELLRNPPRPGDPGAQQTRQIARWYLFSNSTTVCEHFEEKIRDLWRMDQGPQHLNRIFVIVIASIAGGTGCGTFIDIPYFIRKTVRRLTLPSDRFDIYGMLELPDSKLLVDPLDKIGTRNAWSNCYAALRELQYFMTVDLRNNRMPMYRAEFSDGSDFDSNERIFKQVFLLSDQFSDNVSAHLRNVSNEADKKKQYIDIAIPEALTVMISKIQDRRAANRDNNEPGNTIYDFDSGMNNVSGQDIREDIKDQTSHFKLVSTLGVSKLEVPMTEIVAAILNRIFVGMKKRWDIMAKNTRLRESVLKKDLIPALQLEETFDFLKDIIPNATSHDLKRKNYKQTFDAEINGIPNTTAFKERREKFYEKLAVTIDRIYERYGPFFTLKILEPGQYGLYVNAILLNMEPEEDYDGDIWQDLDNYQSFVPGLFKKGKKDAMCKTLLEHFSSYREKKVFEKFKEWVENEKPFSGDISEELGLKYEIDSRYHSGLFTKVTKACTALMDILGSLTKYNPKVSLEEAVNGIAYSVDMSSIKLDEIDKKASAFFCKILVRKNGANEETCDTRDPVYLVRNGNILTEKKDGKDVPVEALPFCREEAKIEKVRFTRITDGGSVQTDWDVIAIEDGLILGNSETPILSIEKFVSNFLLAIKDANEAKVFEVMLDHFTDLTNTFRKSAFENMIILSSSGVDPSKSLLRMNDTEKKRHFARAIEQFNEKAMPSYPIDGDKIEIRRNNVRNYSVGIEPEFSGFYDKILDEIRAPLIPRDRVNKLYTEEFPVMSAVNFYFDYSFSWYLHILNRGEVGDCKKMYDARINSGDGAGLHIEENEAGLDIRPKLVKEL